MILLRRETYEQRKIHGNICADRLGYSIFYYVIMKTSPKQSSDADFPPFQTWKGYNITTTETRQDIKVPRCCMSILVKKLDQYADEDKWIFDCNVNGKRCVYWEYVGVLRAAFNRLGVKLGDWYQFTIDDTNGILYMMLYTKQLWKLMPLTDGREYRSYMKRLPSGGINE